MGPGDGSEGESGADPGPRERPRYVVVKTSIGDEREVADRLAGKLNAGNPDVRSILSPRQLKGYVIVETGDEAGLEEAVRGIRHVEGIVRGGAGMNDIAPFLAGNPPQPEHGGLAEGDEIVITGGPFKGEKARVDRIKRPGEAEASIHVPLRVEYSPRRVLIFGLVAAIVVLVAGCLLWPGLFWDRFLFPYFWGSTEADALGHPVNGATEDYNVVSTVVYGVLLAAAVYLIYTGFKKRGIAIDLNYIIALIPFVLFGTLTRAMEDSFFFSLPAAYVFISPQIYLLVGALVVGLTLLSRRLKPRGAIALLWAMVPVYCLFFIGGYRGDALSEPALLPAAMLLLLTGVLSFSINRRGGVGMDTPAFLTHFGLQSVAAPLFIVAYWCARPGAWGPVNEAGWKLWPAELAIVPALAIGVTLLVWLLLWLLAKRRPGLAPVATGTSALIFFGHFLDAAATYRALDFHSYGEKHVLSNFLIEKAGTALVMFPMKAVAIGAILYVLEVELRKDLEKEALLQGLLRAALLILGLSPGLRDLFRLVMGV